MKNYIHKGISLMLVMTMSTWCLTGCGVTSEEKITSKKADNSNTATTENMEALLSSKVGSAGETDKDETVYIEMSADGTVTKTTVSEVLKVSGSDNIKDYSKLDNIENISGQEKFAKDEDGNIIWENRGKDIKYQGTTTEAAPIDIKITYYLDDKEIAAKDLIGKSGSVKIVYQYTNNAKDDEGNFVPFLTLTGMVFDNDTFSNIDIDHGKVVEQGDSSIVIGYAVPGFKAHLLETIDKAEEYIGDMEIPGSITVTADVKDFSMGMALTATTSDLGDLDLKNTLDFSDVESQMDELQNGADQLVDGTKDLNDGAAKLQDGSVKIYSGARELAKYTKELSSGAKDLNTNYKKFDKGMKAGIKSAKSGAKKLYNGSKELESAAAAVAPGAKELESAANAVNSGTKTVASGISTAKSAFEDQKDTSGKVKKQGLNSGSKALESGAKELSDGAKTANEGVKKVVKTLQDTPDSIEQQIDGVILKVSQATGGAIASKEALNAVVEGINGAVSSGMELTEVLVAKGLDTKSYYALLQAYYSVQTLETVESTFQSQIAANANDIESLLSGMDTLETGAGNLSVGAATLRGGIEQLYGGMKTLDAGADTLADGTGKLVAGAKKLTPGTDGMKKGTTTLKKSLKQLTDGTEKLSTKLGAASTKIKSGISKIDSASSQISAGAGTLSEGTKTLENGIVTLADGTKQLKDGALRLNDEGISKITDIFGKDAKDAVNQIEDTLNAGKGYKSFGGISEDMSGSVKFIFKTAEIKADNK